MDNDNFHKSPEIKEVIENNEFIILMLPPYLSMLNPIENEFAKWKEYVRQQRPSTEAELFDFILNGAAWIKQKIVMVIFETCLDFCQLVLEEFQFLMDN